VSYGRSPFYIFQGEYDNGSAYFCFFDQTPGEDGLGVDIQYDAMAQFVASMWWRDHDLEELANLHGELADLVARGLEVRPELRTLDRHTHTVKGAVAALLSDSATSDSLSTSFSDSVTSE